MKILIHQCRPKKGFFNNIINWFTYVDYGMLGRPKSKRFTKYAVEFQTRTGYERVVIFNFGGSDITPKYNFVQNYEIVNTYKYKIDTVHYCFSSWMTINSNRKNLEILFINRFVEMVAGKDFVSSLNILDIESILKDHIKRGLCIYDD